MFYRSRNKSAKGTQLDSDRSRTLFFLKICNFVFPAWLLVLELKFSVDFFFSHLLSKFNTISGFGKPLSTWFQPTEVKQNHFASCCYLGKTVFSQGVSN